MLGMNKYPKKYIDEARANIDSLLSQYRKLAKSAGSSPALNALEPNLFNHLVLVLDQYFVHRLRGQEGKDGNPLNEVRMLCNSIMLNQGVLKADGTIKYHAADAVLKLEIGARIALDEAGFSRLAKAYFEEIGKKFG